MNAPSGRGLTSDTDKWFDDSMENSPTYQRNPAAIGTHARSIALFSRARRRDATSRTFTERCTIRTRNACSKVQSRAQTSLPNGYATTPPWETPDTNAEGPTGPALSIPPCHFVRDKVSNYEALASYASYAWIPESVIYRFSRFVEITSLAEVSARRWDKDRDKNPNWFCGSAQIRRIWMKIALDVWTQSRSGVAFSGSFHRTAGMLRRDGKLFVPRNGMSQSFTKSTYHPYRALSRALWFQDSTTEKLRPAVAQYFSRVFQHEHAHTRHADLCMHRGHNISHKISGTYPAQGNLAE